MTLRFRWLAALLLGREWHPEVVEHLAQPQDLAPEEQEAAGIALNLGFGLWNALRAEQVQKCIKDY